MVADANLVQLAYTTIQKHFMQTGRAPTSPNWLLPWR